MGIVKRQGLANSVWIYSGLILGYVNVGLLMAKILSTQNFGLRGVIFQAGSFFAVLALVGLANIVNRFFPTLKDEQKSHHGIIGFILTYWLGGTIIMGLILWLFKSHVIAYYSDKSELLIEFFPYILPFGATLALFEGLSAYSRALMKTTVPIFIREFAIRIYNLILLLFLYYKKLDFVPFLQAYLGGYGLALIILIIYLIKIGEWRMKFSHFFAWTSRFGEMIRFGFYTWFNNSMRMIVKTADILMLGVIDLKYAAVYGIGSMIGNIIQVPSQSLRQIGAPLIASYFKEDKLGEIRKLYRKTCMLQLIAGLFIYLLVVLNLDPLFMIWRSEFAEGKIVIVLLGAARLLAGSTGMNGRIITESAYFKSNFIFNLILGITVITSNWILIPMYQIKGAAIASAFSIVLVSGLRVAFVYYKFGWQPFSRRSLFAAVIALGMFAIVYSIPTLPWVLVDVAIKSLLFCLPFVFILAKLRLSPEFNGLLMDLRKKILRKG